MSDIKIKDIKDKTVKTLDKTVAWKERIKDPIVYLNDKVKETTTDNQDVGEYGSDKIKYLSDRAKDETIYSTKRTMSEGKKKTIELIKKKKIKSNNIKTAEKTNKSIKKANRTIKNAQKTARANRLMFERGRKLAIKSAKVAVKGTKAVVKGTIKAIKGMIAAVKSLVGLLIAGGSVAMVVIIVICLIGLLLASIFGIFFSSLKIDIGVQPKTMSECIVDLNDDMTKKITDIENTFIHDEVVINSDRADWKDIIAVYAVKTNGGDNSEEVMSLDIGKQAKLREVFWDMNEITYETKREKYVSTSIGTLDKRDFSLNDSNNTNINSFENRDTQEDETEKIVLYINIKSKSIDDMKTKYAFNESQLGELEEITSEDKKSLWNSVIYGTYGNSGEYTTWRKRGREWSNIRIGSTRATLGEIGCLATSVSMLIAKSGIETPNIEPFNPGTFVTALNYNYGFDAGGNLQYGPISKVVPGFEYVGRVNLRDMSKEAKFAEIKNYYNQGYYIAIEVLGAKLNSQHWVALDEVTESKIIMVDPDTDAIDMWQQYDWNNTTQFIYFKVTK